MSPELTHAGADDDLQVGGRDAEALCRGLPVEPVDLSQPECEASAAIERLKARDRDPNLRQETDQAFVTAVGKLAVSAFEVRRTI